MTEIEWNDRQIRTGKGHPVTCHRKHSEGVEVQLHSFLTLELDGQHHDPVTLAPGKNSATHCSGGPGRSEGCSRPIWRTESILLQPRFELRTVQPLAIRQTDCATPTPQYCAPLSTNVHQTHEGYCNCSGINDCAYELQEEDIH